MQLVTENKTEHCVLDPCCGSRVFWFDRKSDEVVCGLAWMAATERVACQFLF